MEPVPSDSLPQCDWTCSLPPQSSNPFQLEGAGLVCETRRLDSFYDSSGNCIVLPAGQKYTGDKANQGNECALTVTTQWNQQKKIKGTVLVIRSPHMKAAIKAVVPTFSFPLSPRAAGLWRSACAAERQYRRSAAYTTPHFLYVGCFLRGNFCLHPV